MNGSGTGFLEMRVRSPREEAMAREDMCPGCSERGFIGMGRDAEGGEVGTCLCGGCMVVWQYVLAARRRWN